MISPWYPQRQKSNSVAANTMTDATAIPAKPGFTAVITGFACRAVGDAAVNTVFCTISDGTGSSIVFMGYAALAGATNYATAGSIGEMARRFAEGVAVSVTVTGLAGATTVGYTVDYHYEPVYPGFTGL